MSNANPMAAIMQISHAVRLRPAPSGAAGLMLGVMPPIVRVNAAAFQAGFELSHVACTLGFSPYPTQGDTSASSTRSLERLKFGYEQRLSRKPRNPEKCRE